MPVRVTVVGQYDGRSLAAAQRDLDRLKRAQMANAGPMGKMAAGLKQQLTPNFMAMGAAAAAAGAAVAAFAAKLAIDGIRAAAEEEQALIKLQTALNNVGQGFRLPELETFIDNTQRATGVADDQLRPALQTLVTATGDATQSQELLNLALDISVATGKDLTAVSGALAKAANGQFTQVNRLTNGALNPSVLATKDLGVVTDELARLYGGQASANAETFAGKMARLNVAFDELLETFGEGFIEAFTEGADVTGDMGDALRSAEPGMREFGAAVGDLARLFTLFAPVTDELVGTFKYTIPAALASAAAVFPPLAGVMAYLGMEILGTKTESDALAQSGYELSDVFHGPVSSALQAGAYAASGVATSADEAEAEVKSLNDQLKEFFGFLDQRDAVRNYEAAVDDLRKTLKENGKTFDENTEAGRANQEAFDSLFDSAMQVAEGQTTAAEKTETMRQAARDAAAQLDKTGMSEEAKRRLLQPFDDAIARFETATTKVDNLKQAMELIPKEIIVSIYTKTVGGRPPGVSAEEWYGNGAGGGPVGSHGIRRGMSRGSDTVPMLLTPGEMVISRPMVKRFGADFFSQLNSGINPMAGFGGPTVAPSGGGGLVIETLNVTSSADERAEDTVPRALRRLAFVAGL